MTDYSLLFGQ